MKIIEEVSEDVMISEFLRAEINSSRFGRRITENLKVDGKNRKIVTKPNLNDNLENKYRRKLLDKVRGFARRTRIFQNFPRKMKWFRALISKKELTEIKYINYSYWNELTDGTRLPKNASVNVKKKRQAYGVGNQIYFDIVSELEKGKTFPLMILVAKNKKSRIVVLEGHARLTSYFLAPKYIPKELEVIIGFSNNMSNWDLY